MNILEQINRHSLQMPERIAIQCNELTLTYRELEEQSNILAAAIAKRIPGRVPVAVYGHKHPMMLVCFLALVKSGHGYCPIDTSVPDERVNMILDALDCNICLALEPLTAPDRQVLTFSDIEQMLTADCDPTSALTPVQADEIFYMIFTSGSTGVPKGVMITRSNLEHYLDWSITLGSSMEDKSGSTFLNQAPFSFDLSVMDTYTSLACGGTLWALTKEVQTDYRKLYASLLQSNIKVWVSTPSFAEICMSDPVFCAENLCSLHLFLFCGETLSPQTAAKLRRRFPDAVIMNTYGPTESTVAVTGVLIDDSMIHANAPLPVGRAKPGTYIEIHNKAGEILPDGEKGEIHILGDTVSAGYYHNPEGSAKAFYETTRDGKLVRGYHSGDEGYLINGLLYYSGRIDLQIKLHGYRIELEDIENNILRLPDVTQAVVVPNMRRGAVRSLTAYLVAASDIETIRSALSDLLPHYMIPKKIVLMDRLPMTNNGKIDRKQLGGTAS